MRPLGFPVYRISTAGSEESGDTTKHTFERSRCFGVHDGEVFKMEEDVMMDW